MQKLRPVAICVIASTAAFAADRISIDNLVVTLGSTAWRAPNIEISGSSLPEAELKQLFSGDSAAIDARLARLNATRAKIPSLSSETRGATETERASYRDLVAENIAAGRVGLWRSSGGESTVEPADGGTQHYVWGPSTSKGVDLRLMTRIALGARAGASEALKPFVEEEVVENMRAASTNDDLVMQTGRIAMLDVKARPLATPMEKLFERIEKADPEKPDAALMAEILDALLSFEAASVEANAVNITGKGEPIDKPFSAKIAHIGARKLAGGGAGEATLENFAMQASDGGRLTVERFNLRDLQLAPLLRGQDYFKLAHIETKAIDGDLPDAKTSEKSRVKFHVDNASADFGNFIETIPTKFSAKIDHASVDLAARGETDSTAQFLALGYKTLDFSAAAAGEWREKTSDASIGPIVFEGKDMGVMRIAADLSNVSSALFSSTEIVSKAAALAVSIKSLDVTLEGGELVERLLAADAKDRKIAIDKARAEYAKTASEAFVALAGGGEKAKKIGEAVAAYIMKPKRLHLRISAPKGVGALEALAKKPGDILEGAEVEAVAER